MSSYSLYDHRRSSKEALLFADAIEAIDSAAIYEGSRWYSMRLEPSDCDTVLVLPEEGIGKSAMVLIGKHLPGGVLWVHPHGPANYERYLPMFGGPDYGQRFRDLVLKLVLPYRKEEATATAPSSHEIWRDGYDCGSHDALCAHNTRTINPYPDVDSKDTSSGQADGTL